MSAGAGNAERDESLLLLARMARRAGVNPYSTLLAAFDAEMRIRGAFPTWPDCNLAEVLRAVPDAMEAPSWRDQLERHRAAYARTFLGWKRSTPGMRNRGAKLLEPLTTETDSARESHLRRELAAVARLIGEPSRDSARIVRTLERKLAFLIPDEARRLKRAGDPRSRGDIRDDLRRRHGLEMVKDESQKRRRQRARKAQGGGQGKPLAGVPGGQRTPLAGVPSPRNARGPKIPRIGTAATPQREGDERNGRKAHEHRGPRRGASRPTGEHPAHEVGRVGAEVHKARETRLVRPDGRSGMAGSAEAHVHVRPGPGGLRKRRPPP